MHVKWTDLATPSTRTVLLIYSALSGRRTIVAGDGAVPPSTVCLSPMTVGAVHAHRAVSQLLSEHGPELKRRSQFHVHGSGQVVFAEQWQRCPVDRLLPETLENTNKIYVSQIYDTERLFL